MGNSPLWNKPTSGDTSRYQKFRALAVTDVETLRSGNIDIYHVYCLGNKSFVSSERVKDFKLIRDEHFTSFEVYRPELHLRDHHYLNDCGMGDKNNNQHLIFLDKDIADEYAKACRNDSEEVERCNTFDKYDDNDYDAANTSWGEEET